MWDRLGGLMTTALLLGRPLLAADSAGAPSPGPAAPHRRRPPGRRGEEPGGGRAARLRVDPRGDRGHDQVRHRRGEPRARRPGRPGPREGDVRFHRGRTRRDRLAREHRGQPHLPDEGDGAPGAHARRGHRPDPGPAGVERRRHLPGGRVQGGQGVRRRLRGGEAPTARGRAPQALPRHDARLPPGRPHPGQAHPRQGGGAPEAARAPLHRLRPQHLLREAGSRHRAATSSRGCPRTS